MQGLSRPTRRLPPAGRAGRGSRPRAWRGRGPRVRPGRSRAPMAAHPAMPGLDAAAVVTLVPPRRDACASKLAAAGPGTPPSDDANGMRPDVAYVDMAWDDPQAGPKAWARGYHRHVADTADALRDLLTWLRDAYGEQARCTGHGARAARLFAKASRSHVRRWRSLSVVSPTCLRYLCAQALGTARGSSQATSTYAPSGRMPLAPSLGAAPGPAAARLDARASRRGGTSVTTAAAPTPGMAGCAAAARAAPRAVAKGAGCGSAAAPCLPGADAAAAPCAMRLRGRRWPPERLTPSLRLHTCSV